MNTLIGLRSALRSSARLAWEMRDPKARERLRGIVRFALESPENVELTVLVAFLVIALGFHPVGGGARRS